MVCVLVFVQLVYIRCCVLMTRSRTVCATIDEPCSAHGVFPHILDSYKHSPLSCLHQLVPDAAADYFLTEEKIPLSKEKCDTKKVLQQRPLASDEKVLRVLHSWQPEDGCVGRICLKAKEEVKTNMFIRHS